MHKDGYRKGQWTFLISYISKNLKHSKKIVCLCVGHSVHDVIYHRSDMALRRGVKVPLFGGKFYLCLESPDTEK